MKRLEGPKRCPKCGGAGPFGKSTRRWDGLSCWCKKCCKQAADGRKERAAKGQLERLYGVSNFEELFKEQGGACAICRRPAKLCVDHNHKTKKVRGLLCHKCNTGIGLLQENVEVLRTAISYLEREIRP